MGKVSSGFNTLNNILKFVKYAPYIGTAVNAVKTTITAIRPPFDGAYERVKQIDDRVYPVKPRIDSATSAIDEGEGKPGPVLSLARGGRIARWESQTRGPGFKSQPCRAPRFNPSWKK